MKLVDVAYGGENGFNQAIELAQDVLGDVKFIKEKKLIGEFFDQISSDTSLYCFGIDDTIRALEMGAMRVLILWEELPHKRYVCTHQSWDSERVYFMTEEQAIKNKIFTNEEDGTQVEVEVTDFVEYAATNYKKFGCTLEFVTNKSQEGAQFVRGFQGVGGLLRYKVDFVQLNALEQGEVDDEDTGKVGGEDFNDDDFM
eukprot:Sspe_Gene.29929::Locus_14474_Transcript_1_1_Confidence_1.000_Length_1415::g.29929::m.29929/K03265/ETF1, ERF1; peptide chain release factor subunit 1